MKNKYSLRSLLLEVRRDPKSYPSAFEEFNNELADVDDCIWIFYDTESTGLKVSEPFVQVTQIGAVAFHPRGFTSTPETVKNGEFNMRIYLDDAALERLNNEPDVYWSYKEDPENPGKMISKPSTRKTTNQVLAMNDYYGYFQDGVFPEDMHTVGIEFLNYLERMRQASPNGQIIIIAHNNKFDDDITTEMFRRIGEPMPTEEIWDSLRIVNLYFKKIITDLKKQGSTDPEHQRLIQALSIVGKSGRVSISSAIANLTKAFNIDSQGHHNAIADVKMSMNVLYAVIQWLRKYYEA